MILKYRKDYVNRAIARMEEATPTRLRAETITALKEWQKAVDIVEDVEDVVGTCNNPCPVQSTCAVMQLRALLGIRPPDSSKAKKEVRNSKTITCGKGPYSAKIVSSQNPDNIIWDSGRAYATESAAVKGIIQWARKEAEKRRCWVVTPYGKHWITENKEHAVDFGSLLWVGLITGKAKSRKHK